MELKKKKKENWKRRERSRRRGGERRRWKGFVKIYIIRASGLGMRRRVLG